MLMEIPFSNCEAIAHQHKREDSDRDHQYAFDSLLMFQLHFSTNRAPHTGKRYR